MLPQHVKGWRSFTLFLLVCYWLDILSQLSCITDSFIMRLIHLSSSTGCFYLQYIQKANDVFKLQIMEMKHMLTICHTINICSVLMLPGQYF